MDYFAAQESFLEATVSEKMALNALKGFIGKNGMAQGYITKTMQYHTTIGGQKRNIKCA